MEHSEIHRGSESEPPSVYYGAVEPQSQADTYELLDTQQGFAQSLPRERSPGLDEKRVELSASVGGLSEIDSGRSGSATEHYFRRMIPWEEILSYQQEFSGMLGDLGLYLPLVVALSLSGQIDLASTLIFTGLANIITGMTFKVPMCVQPMKSIAAVALADKLTNPQIMAGGILTGTIVAVLGLTNLIGTVNSLVPDPVVRGLQLGLGLKMFKKAVQMLPNEGVPSWDASLWIQWDGYMTATLAFAFTIIFVRSSRVPTAFILFVSGLVIAAIRLSENGGHFGMGLSEVKLVHISGTDWLVGLLQGAIPQVPTTLLNSCIAVCRLSEDLYPGRVTGVNVRTVSSSVGLLNLVFPWFGGLPVCHGSGGLAGQHRFGARTNLSIIVLGICKMLPGICFSAGLLQLLQHFPSGFLAAMLAVSAFELASAARSGLAGDSDDVRMCLLTCCFVVFFNTAIGFIVGLIAYYVVQLSRGVIGAEDDVKDARTKWSHNIARVKLGLSMAGKGRRPSSFHPHREAV